eukprot:1664642-Rhodomonas_salina.1
MPWCGLHLRQLRAHPPPLVPPGIIYKTARTWYKLYGACACAGLISPSVSACAAHSQGGAVSHVQCVISRGLTEG